MLWIQSLRRRPRLIALSLSFLSAILAMLLAYNWTQRQQAHFQEISKPKGGTIDVLVFSKSLEPGDALSQHTLSVRTVQRALVPEGLYTPDQFSQVEGRVVALSVRKGEIVLPQSLAITQHQDSIALARPGFRLIPVDRSSGQMAWGAMTPRDRIDVWSIGLNPEEFPAPGIEQGGFVKETNSTAQAGARPIASGIRVLSSSGPTAAVGRSATGDSVTSQTSYFLELPVAVVSAYLSAASSSQVRFVLNVNGKEDRHPIAPKPKPVEIFIHEEGVKG